MWRSGAPISAPIALTVYPLGATVLRKVRTGGACGRPNVKCSRCQEEDPPESNCHPKTEASATVIYKTSRRMTQFKIDSVRLSRMSFAAAAPTWRGRDAPTVELRRDKSSHKEELCSQPSSHWRLVFPSQC